jgi:hypothetical protein
LTQERKYALAAALGGVDAALSKGSAIFANVNQTKSIV